jgi:Uri superfamily endonuclease
LKGIYAIIFSIDKERYIKVGKLGRILFKSGNYVYIGSAFSGIRRLKRHITNLKNRKVSNPHWHIDYIVPYSNLIEYIFIPCESRIKERELANKITGNLDYVPRFGSSDSNAPSHLFFSRKLDELKVKLRKSIYSLDLRPLKAMR